jgi:hypothetical protein
LRSECGGHELAMSFILSASTVKKLDPALLAQIKSALQIGYEAYQARGWV